MFLLIYACTCEKPITYNGASVHNSLEEAKEAAQLHNEEVWEEGDPTEITWRDEESTRTYGTSGENYFIIDHTFQ